MRRNKHTKSKIVLAIIGVAISFVGIGYASWTDQLTIDQNVTTGKMAFEVKEEITSTEATDVVVDLSKPYDIREEDTTQSTKMITPGADWQLQRFVEGREKWLINYTLSPLQESTIGYAAPIDETFKVKMKINQNDAELQQKLQETFSIQDQGILSEIIAFIKPLLPAETIDVYVHHTLEIGDSMEGKLILYVDPAEAALMQGKEMSVTYETKRPNMQLDYSALLNVPLEYELTIPLLFDQFNVRGE